MARSLNRAGLSLLEVMLAIALMGVVVVGILVVMGGGLRLMNQAGDVTRARELATQEMENIRQSAYAYSPDGTNFDARSGTAAVGGYPPAPYNPAPGETYKLAVAVQRVNPTLRSIRVDVYWGVNHNIHLETLMNP
ncbi:unnamed protein product [Phaeothamnion confervicola]